MVVGNLIRLNKRGYSVLALFLLILLYYQFRTHKQSQDEVNLSDLLRVSIQAAEAGGKLVVSTRNHLNIHLKGKTKEGMDDSVTTADLLSHCAMKGLIQRSFPNVAFISEESKVPCDADENLWSSNLLQSDVEIERLPVKASDVTVWIDPLDATHEYTEKLYEYVTTMVCVAVKGKPVIGVIHSPFSNVTSWAVDGSGYSQNLKKPKLKGDALKAVKVIVSRSHSGSIKEILKKSCRNCEVVIAAGAGYKALKVAEGSVQAYLHTTDIKKWDICAGNAIINALGGQMTTRKGDLLSYSNDSNVVNSEGLIATLENHEYFIDKLNYEIVK